MRATYQRQYAASNALLIHLEFINKSGHMVRLVPTKMQIEVWNEAGPIQPINRASVDSLATAISDAVVERDTGHRWPLANKQKSSFEVNLDEHFNLTAGVYRLRVRVPAIIRPATDRYVIWDDLEVNVPKLQIREKHDG